MGVSLTTEGGDAIALDGSSDLLGADAPAAPAEVPFPPTWDVAAFLAQFQGLLPRGVVWPRDPDAVQTKALTALMPTYVRQAERSANLVVDAFPASTNELLPEWEETLGLPDPCAGPSPSIEQRRAHVVARLAGRGGQSALYFREYAANLGYSITIQQFAPARVGTAAAGQPMNGTAWAHTWAVQASLNTIVYAAAGQSVAGDPLAAWGNAVLECELNAIKPAHTILQFQYV